MLKILFRSSALEDEQMEIKKSLQILDAVKSGIVDLNVTMRENPLRIAEKFEEALFGTPFKVTEMRQIGDDAIEIDILPVKPPQHSDVLLFQEVEMRLAEFERQNALPPSSQLCCAY